MRLALCLPRQIKLKNMKKIVYLLAIVIIAQSFFYMKKTFGATNQGEVSIQNFYSKSILSDIFFSKTVKLCTVIIENKFVATGIINDIVRVEKGIKKIIMLIEKVEQFGDFPNLGTDYIGKSVEIFSEIGIPPSIIIGAKVSLVLRVSGDEWGQSLFLMEIFSNE